MGSIYKITNTVNGKVYIGQTVNDAVKTRIRPHLNGDPRGNNLIKKDLVVYGKYPFTFEILHDGIIPEFLGTLEDEEIKKHDCVDPNGYNEVGAKKSPSLATRKKMSESHKGKEPWNKGKTDAYSDEARRNMSEGQKGKKASEETRRKMSESGKSKTFSKEHRRNLSEANKGRKASEETRRKQSEAKQDMSEETRRKIGEAGKGRTPWNKGKTFSDEARHNMSKAKKLPEYHTAHQLFTSLSMSVDEKRKLLYQKFPQVKKTIQNWVRKWQKGNH